MDEGDEQGNGIEVSLADGRTKVYFGVLFVRDVKHSLEFFESFPGREWRGGEAW